MVNNESYWEILQEELFRRCAKNSSYSLRAFARDLEISPSRLSEVLNRKSGLSLPSASKIVEKLGFPKHEREYFLASVAFNHGRSERIKERAQVVLNRLQKKSRFKPFRLDAFRYIADWFHFAILELTHVSDFKPDIDWVARRLSLDTEVVRSAVERLKKMGLLTVGEKAWHQSVTDVAIASAVPSTAIREHHRQILKKATESIECSQIDERSLSSITFGFDSAQMLEAEAAIKEFRRAFMERFESKNPDRVYAVAIQFFPLDRKEDL